MVEQSASQLLNYFENESRKAKDAASAIMDKADQEARDLTPEEKIECDAFRDDYRKYKEKAAAERSKIELRKQLEGEEGNDGLDGVVRSTGSLKGEPDLKGGLGDVYIKSGEFKALQKRASEGKLGQFKTPPVEIPYEVLSKAASSPLLESNASSVFGGNGILTTILPGVEQPGLRPRRLVVADLIPVVPITMGNSATYLIEKTQDWVAYPGDVPVAENAVKPSTQYEFDVVTQRLIKLAAITKISSEFLEDAPAVAAFINADLPRNIRTAEEDYMVTVLYAGVSTASGLSGGTAKFDLVLDAITTIQLSNFEPDGMLIHPTDWSKLLVSKASTSGDYLGGGPFSATNNPWGIRIVVSQAATVGHPLVGDFANGAKTYRRGGLNVDSTNADGTDFEKNIVTFRAEERLVTAKTYPEAFVQTASI